MWTKVMKSFMTRRMEMMFTSDWTPGGTGEKEEEKDKVEGGYSDDKDKTSDYEYEGEEKKDSIGSLISSPDFVDKDRLQVWEETLSTEEKEQKRLEANQYKMVGNAL